MTLNGTDEGSAEEGDSPQNPSPTTASTHSQGGPGANRPAFPAHNNDKWYSTCPHTLVQATAHRVCHRCRLNDEGTRRGQGGSLFPMMKGTDNQGRP
jgi:hypothetical protein